MGEIRTPASAIMRSMLVTVALGCSLTGQADAGTEIDIATGRQLASDHCSQCHGIDVENFILVQGALPPLISHQRVMAENQAFARYRLA